MRMNSTAGLKIAIAANMAVFFLSVFSVIHLMAVNDDILRLIASWKVGAKDYSIDERGSRCVGEIYAAAINSNRFSIDVFLIILALCCVHIAILCIVFHKQLFSRVKLGTQETRLEVAV